MRRRETRVDDTVIVLIEDAAPKPRVPELIFDAKRNAWCSPEVYKRFQREDAQAEDWRRTPQGAWLAHAIRDQIPGFPGFNIWWS